MKCPICRSGETKPDRTSVMLNRGETTFVIHGVPADVCNNCGEEYVGEMTAAEILRVVEDEARTGIQFAVRRYQAA
jgi:YgiT-type zinc finger domain-containing protein